MEKVISLALLFKLCSIAFIYSQAVNAAFIFSNADTLTTEVKLPYPWRHEHIGEKGGEGEVFYQGNGFQINSKSGDIWSKSDNFHFVFKQLKGNFQILVQVNPENTVDIYEKAGIMIREKLSDSARNVALLLANKKDISFQSRLIESSVTYNKGRQFEKSQKNNWLKVVRNGDDFYSFFSPDGFDWDAGETMSCKMDQDVFVGLAVSGNNYNKPYRVAFTDLEIVQKMDEKGPKAPVDISYSALSPRAALLHWQSSKVDKDVLGYDIFVNNKKINNKVVLKTNYTVGNLTTGKNVIEIKAVNVVGANSDPSALIVYGDSLYLTDVSNAPAGNPIVPQYPVRDHWTQRLKWNNVINASSIDGLINRQGEIDSLALHNLIHNLSVEGGGVIFFPAGDYFLNFSVKLESGVILRGQTPMETTKATESAFSPSTKFNFLRYAPVRSGTGAPNAAAFKTIYADTLGVTNTGLVNLDINRAVIDFDGGGRYWESLYYQKDISVLRYKYKHNNVIIYGIRQNNAAIPDPNIPSLIQTQEGHGWQRWPWEYGYNMNIWVSQNCLIANCRLNDAVTDNFEQPDYLTDVYIKRNGEQAKFNYLNHHAVNVNYNKIYYDKQGNYHVEAPTLSKSRDIYPEFASGIEIKDNYIVVGRRDFTHIFSPNTMILQENLDSVKNTVITCCSREPFITNNGLYPADLYNWEKLADDTLLLKKGELTFAQKKTLPYRLALPYKYDPSEKYPLVIFLHGIGEAGDDNQTQLKHFAPYLLQEKVRKEYPSFIIFPQHPSDNLFNSKEISSPPTWTSQAVLELVVKLFEKYPINQKKVYLIGISSGGAAAWEFLVRYPKRFAAVMSFGGLLMISSEKIAKRIKHKPIWHFHGATDKHFPVQYAKYALSKNEKFGVKNQKLTIYEKGHASWTSAEKEQHLLSWLFSLKIRK